MGSPEVVVELGSGTSSTVRSRTRELKERPRRGRRGEGGSELGQSTGGEDVQTERNQAYNLSEVEESVTAPEYAILSPPAGLHTAPDDDAILSPPAGLHTAPDDDAILSPPGLNTVTAPDDDDVYYY